MWFTETPWPPFCICSVIAAVFFAQWYVHRRPRQLQLSIAFLALGGVVILVERLIVTESERVENNVYALARAFEAGDGGAVPSSSHSTMPKSATSCGVSRVRCQSWGAFASLIYLCR